MEVRERLSLNRIASPKLPLAAFLELAQGLGFRQVEVRNDMGDGRPLDGLDDAALAAALERTGVRVLTINALYPFEFGPRLEANVAKLRAMVADARRVNCPGVVMCPWNEPGDTRTPAERERDLVRALDAYGPIFEEAGMTGLVEPLGFGVSALRTKRAALDGIRRSAHAGRYKLVHDTFHHHLAGERELFPRETGLIHVSGVLAGKATDALTDDDRLLVDAADVMDSKAQVAALLAGGCEAPISFEPFSKAVQGMDVSALRSAIVRSVEYLLA